METVTLTAVVSALSEACHSACPVLKKQVMIALDRFQNFDNYVSALIRIIDINDSGSSVSQDCRHLAVVLLKNFVGKSGCSIANDLPKKTENTTRKLLPSERIELKAFLVRYLYEPSCKIALQLSLIAAKLARQDGDQWLQVWPELIPSLVNVIQSHNPATNSNTNTTTTIKDDTNVSSISFIGCMRGLSTLSEVLKELSSKASTTCTSSHFGKTYSILSAQLYPVISKLWCENMKKFSSYLNKLNTQTMNTNMSYFGTSITNRKQAELESLIIELILISRILRIILEYGLDHIITTYTTFFKSFWRCYLGSIKLISDFIRKYRPFCLYLRQSLPYSPGSASSCNACNSTYISDMLICMKYEVMHDDDIDELCDAYIPLEYAQNNEEHTHLLSFINLSLKLTKNLVCAPVVLQRKYPILLLPCLDCLLDYYYTFLVEEYTALAIQTEELSVILTLPNTTTNTTSSSMEITQKGLTSEKKEAVYSAQCNRDLLPLNYLTMASIRFLHNVLTCSAYDICNIYKPTSTTTSTNMNGQEECSMEECAEIKTDVAKANEIRVLFFNKERITSLLYILLYPLLSYCEKELLIWAENPEDFMKIVEQSSANDILSIKPFAESLFYGLIEVNPTLVCSILAPLLLDCHRQEIVLSPISTSSSDTSSSNMNICGKQQYFMNRELKLYDSVYVCAGLGVAHLAPYLGYVKKQYDLHGNSECNTTDTTTCSNTSNNAHSSSNTSGSIEGIQNEDASYWVQHYLGPMVQELLLHPTAGCLLLPPHKLQLLRARLVWLLSIWMNQFDGAVLPHVLSILIDIIGPAGDSDIVVKMQAVHALQALLNLPLFDVSALKLRVVSAVEALCLLVQGLEESECKITVLTVAGDLIRLLSIQLSTLRPLVAPLAGYLENLYTKATAGDPAKTTILEVLVMLVSSAKHYSAEILTITTPLIINATTYRVQSTDQYCTSCDQGYLVQDGIALWLAVMRNLTEQQYVLYHEDLHKLFLTIYVNLGFYSNNNTTASTTSSSNNGGTVYDVLCSDTERNAITKDMLLVLEAYALLGGEAHSILHNQHCQAAIAQFYAYCLPASTAIDTSLSSYLMRPLQSFLFTCPVLATTYLQQVGTLTEILRSCYASVACTNLSTIYTKHQQKPLTLTYYLTFIAQILLINPDLLYFILTQLKIEILNYILQIAGKCNECILTETILLSELVNLMFQLYEQLEYIPAPNYHKKVWNLALLSLFPPTIVNNTAVVPPYLSNTTPYNRKNITSSTDSSSSSSSSKKRPDCLIGRTMLMIMNTMQFTVGRAKLEQYQYNCCNNSSNTTSSDATTVDYYSLCYWFPSTLTSDHLYNWVSPLVRTCRESLRFERTEQSKTIIQCELHSLVHRDYEENDHFTGFPTDSSSSSSSSSSSNNSRRSSSGSNIGNNTNEESNMMHTIDTTTTDTVTMSNTITIQDGDQIIHDCAIEPIVQLYYNRIKQSGILEASLQAHLTEKFSQLCRTLGETLFSQLECIADLDL